LKTNKLACFHDELLKAKEIVEKRLGYEVLGSVEYE
jgi:hypothetical protein